MSKINWNRQSQSSVLNKDFWADPKKGFDKEWHTKRAQIKTNLGIHQNHEIEYIKELTGPHAGKAVCKTCGGKFVSWLPKGSF